jgi:hypothetical protein
MSFHRRRPPNPSSDSFARVPQETEGSLRRPACARTGWGPARELLGSEQRSPATPTHADFQSQPLWCSLRMVGRGTETSLTLRSRAGRLWACVAVVGEARLQRADHDAVARTRLEAAAGKRGRAACVGHTLGANGAARANDAYLASGARGAGWVRARDGRARTSSDRPPRHGAHARTARRDRSAGARAVLVVASHA